MLDILMGLRQLFQGIGSYLLLRLVNFFFHWNRPISPITGKISLHFIFVSPSLWPSWRELYQLCRYDSCFEVTVVFCDVERDRREIGKGATAQFIEARNFLEVNGIQWIDIREYDPTHVKPHALVYQSPYEYREIRKYLDVRKVKAMGIRPLYISYGIEFDETLNNNFLQDLQYQKKLHIYAWRIYVMHHDIEERFAACCPAGSKHVRAFGHPRFDYYAIGHSSDWKPDYMAKADGKPIIVFQLHHPSNCDCQGEGYHTWHPGKIRSAIHLLQANTNIFTVVTMHPLYEERAAKFGLMTRDEFKDMKTMIANHPQSFLYKGDYQPLLMDAAAFISENSSLLIDMGFFDKPVLYLYDRPVALLPFAKKLAETFHHGRKVEDIEIFIKMVLDRDDPLLLKRNTLRPNIYYNYPTGVAELIKRDIESGIRSNR